MAQPALRFSHRRLLAALALTVTTAITLSACSSGDSGGQHRPAPAAPDTSRRTTGVIDTTAAREVVDAYQAANNAANARQDLKGLARIEAGMAYVQDRSDYQQWKTWPAKERTRYASGFRYEQRAYYIPRAGTATWFAMEATSSDAAKARGLFVFDRRGGRYKMVTAVYATGKMPMPKIAVDSHGLATAVDPARKVGALAPKDLTAAVTDLYVTGGSKQGRQLAPTPASKEAVRLHDDRNRGAKASWRTASYFSAQPAHPQVYSLRTADGGVLALAPGAYTIEYLHTRYLHGGLIIPGPQEAVYNANHRPVITDEYQGEALVALSPTQAKLIARDFRLVDSR
ncbi:hypothetical protein ABZZ74_48095 [Streptomyces sp. NPDC006476]|uniref:hypothetical protein n=1 Tax=Streptomyces sp. NPDC006476 TaxID=3157175 RepID=UPI0033AEC7AD